MKKHLFKRQFSKKNALLSKVFCASILGSSLLLVQDQLATAGPQPNKQEKYYISEVENNPLISNQPIRSIHQYISNHSLSQNFTNVNFGDKGYKGPEGGSGGGGSGGGENKNHKRPAHNSQEPDHANISQKNYTSSVISLDLDKVGIKKDQQLYTINLEEKNEEHPLKKEKPKLKPIPVKDQFPKKIKPKLKPLTDEERIPSPDNDPFGFSKWAHTTSPNHKANSLKVASNRHSNTQNTVDVNTEKASQTSEKQSAPRPSPGTDSEPKTQNFNNDLTSSKSGNNKNPLPHQSKNSNTGDLKNMTEDYHLIQKSHNSNPAAKPLSPPASKGKPIIKTEQSTTQLAAAAGTLPPPAGFIDRTFTETPSYDGPFPLNVPTVPQSRQHSTAENFHKETTNDQVENFHKETANDQAVKYQHELVKRVWSGLLNDKQRSSKPNSHTSTPREPMSSLENDLYDDETGSQEGEGEGEGEAGEIKSPQKDRQTTEVEENTQDTSQSTNHEVIELTQNHDTHSTPDETSKSTPTNHEVAESNEDQDKHPTSDQISRQTKIQNYANRINLVHLQLHALQAVANHMETWSSNASASSSSVLPAAGEYDDESLPLFTGLMKKGTFVPWISGHYGKSIQGKVKDRAAYRGDLGGVSIGTDFVLNECTVLGVSYTKITSKLKYRQDRLGDKETTDSQTFALYGQYNFNDTLFAQSALAYTKGLTKHNFKNQENYKSSSKGFAGFVSLNKVFAVSKNTFIVPRVGLRYIQNKEKDVQVGDTKITGAKNRYLTAILGSKILFRKNFGEVSITPGLYAGLEQPIVVKNQGAKASIIEAGQTFEYQCPAGKSKNLSYNLGAEISAKRKNLVLSLSYQCSLAKKYASHQGSLKIGIAF